MRCARIGLLLFCASVSFFSLAGKLQADEQPKNFETVWNGLKLNYQMLSDEVTRLQSNLSEASEELQKLKNLNAQQLAELKMLNGLSLSLRADLANSARDSENLKASLTQAQNSLRQATAYSNQVARRKLWVTVCVGLGALVLGTGAGLLLGLALF